MATTTSASDVEAAAAVAVVAHNAVVGTEVLVAGGAVAVDLRSLRVVRPRQQTERRRVGLYRLSPAAATAATSKSG